MLLHIVFCNHAPNDIAYREVTLIILNSNALILYILCETEGIKFQKEKGMGAPGRDRNRINV